MAQTIAPDEAYGWPRHLVTGPVRVVKCDRRPGHHGGTVTLTVVAPAGCRFGEPPPPPSGALQEALRRSGLAL